MSWTFRPYGVVRIQPQETRGEPRHIPCRGCPRAGLSETRYGNYVSGRREPDLATLVRIASVLATTPNDLLMSRTVQKTPTDLTRQRAMAALAALQDDDLERVTTMIEALAAKRA